MKNFSLLFFVILLALNACKDDCQDIPCEGPDCPLSTGEYCIEPMINVDDQCVCPEELTPFDGKCLDLDNPFTDNFEFILLDTINCGCVQNRSLMINLNTDPNDFYGLYWLHNITGSPLNFDSAIDGPPTEDNFYVHLYPFQRCNPEDTGFAIKPLYMHGSILGDTLYYDLFFYNSLDTCKGFKQGDARL